MIYKNKTELIEQTVRGSDVVLDVGFVGHGIKEDHPHSSHSVLKRSAKELYGLDLHLPPAYENNPRYRLGTAENFDFPVKFDVIYAGDLIEHLSNCGMFLNSCRRNLKEGGKLIITTPNAFNLFNLAEKLTKREPTVNADHTAYFNSKTLSMLLQKNGFTVINIDFLYTLDIKYPESWKKKALDEAYWFLSLFTDKFIETLVVVAG